MYEPFAKTSAREERRAARRGDADSGDNNASPSCLTVEQPLDDVSSSPHGARTSPAWTEPEHQSYIRHMEEDFVDKMYSMQYCSQDICGARPPYTATSPSLIPCCPWSSSIDGLSPTGTPASGPRDYAGLAGMAGADWGAYGKELPGFASLGGVAAGVKDEPFADTDLNLSPGYAKAEPSGDFPIGAPSALEAYEAMTAPGRLGSLQGSPLWSPWACRYFPGLASDASPGVYRQYSSAEGAETRRLLKRGGPEISGGGSLATAQDDEDECAAAPSSRTQSLWTSSNVSSGGAPPAYPVSWAEGGGFSACPVAMLPSPDHARVMPGTLAVYQDREAALPSLLAPSCSPSLDAKSSSLVTACNSEDRSVAPVRARSWLQIARASGAPGTAQRGHTSSQRSCDKAAADAGTVEQASGGAEMPTDAAPAISGTAATERKRRRIQAASESPNAAVAAPADAPAAPEASPLPARSADAAAAAGTAAATEADAETSGAPLACPQLVSWDRKCDGVLDTATLEGAAEAVIPTQGPRTSATAGGGGTAAGPPVSRRSRKAASSKGPEEGRVSEGEKRGQAAKEGAAKEATEEGVTVEESLAAKCGAGVPEPCAGEDAGGSEGREAGPVTDGRPETPRGGCSLAERVHETQEAQKDEEHEAVHAVTGDEAGKVEGHKEGQDASDGEGGARPDDEARSVDGERVVDGEKEGDVDHHHHHHHHYHFHINIFEARRGTQGGDGKTTPSTAGAETNGSGSPAAGSQEGEQGLGKRGSGRGLRGERGEAEGAPSKRQRPPGFISDAHSASRRNGGGRAGQGLGNPGTGVPAALQEAAPARCTPGAPASPRPPRAARDRALATAAAAAAAAAVGFLCDSGRSAGEEGAAGAGGRKAASCNDDQAVPS